MLDVWRELVIGVGGHFQVIVGKPQRDYRRCEVEYIHTQLFHGGACRVFGGDCHIEFALFVPYGGPFRSVAHYAAVDGPCYGGVADVAEFRGDGEFVPDFYGVHSVFAVERNHGFQP